MTSSTGQTPIVLSNATPTNYRCDRPVSKHDPDTKCGGPIVQDTLSAPAHVLIGGALSERPVDGLKAVVLKFRCGECGNESIRV